MTTVDRYLLGRFLSMFLKIALSLSALFIMIDLFTHTQDNIIKYNIPLAVVAKYYLTFVPTILFRYQGAALAVLVAGLMVLGKAARNNEITALLAGGVKLGRIVRVLVLAALSIGVLAFAIEETAGVRAAESARSIEREYFARFMGESKTGVSWTNLNGGWTCHIHKFNTSALTGEDVLLHGPGLHEEIRARRIYWDELRAEWMLEDGVWAAFNADQEMASTVTRITQRAAPFSETPEQLFALEEPPDTKSAKTLGEDLARAESLGIPTQWQQVEYHAKFAQPALCFIMILIAIPFAVRLRFGGPAIGLGVGIAIGMAYVMLFYFSLGLGYLEVFSPLVAAWLANGVFLVAGVVLMAKTPT